MMIQKRYLYICSLMALFCLAIVSCDIKNETELDGQWQLKTITENNVVSTVDTIFYSFQQQKVFAFTELETPDIARISYGYIDFVSETELSLSMQRENWQTAPNFEQISGWGELKKTFKIERLDSKKLVLSADGRVYSFKRY